MSRQAELVELISEITGVKAKKIIEQNISTILSKPGSIKALTKKEVEKINKLMSFTRLWHEIEFINERTIIASSSKAMEFCAKILKGITDREHFKMLLLDSQNNLLDVVTLSIGTINECVIFRREIIKHILLADASHIILTHNHPGNTLKFSDSDKAITQKIKNAVQSIEAKLLDHILVTADGQTESMANLSEL